MPTNIKCPGCGTEFPIEEAVSEEYKKELREQMVAYKKQKDEEFLKKEKEFQSAIQSKDAEFAKRLQEEKNALQRTLEENLKKSIGSDYENQLKILQQSNKDNEEKLRLSRQKELEFLQKEKQLKTKEEELEISLQRKLLEEREKMKGELIKEEASRLQLKEQEFQLKMKELEKQLEDQKKLTEEMKRRQEQGSMQLQGEAQELLLEEILRNAFPFDTVEEVGKGIRGADCIQTVRNNFGQECGKIIYESKRTEHFGADWIEKLKADMHSQGADIAVIVTKAMPKDMHQFGERNGVYICSFKEVTSVTAILRNAIIRVSEVKKSQENKGEKMVALYNYLTSHEFTGNMNALREGFRNL
ncbi:MAG TPA: DUF2130 domain-containing protein, partial [Chitinophagaceae bacterium]|nr:DUF2130 domain-containing protein [Chitinophagaceae bacterium]